MKTLFKYYSSNFDIIKHLNEPAIKLATTASLNDPFEKELSEDLAISLSDKLLQLKYFKEKDKKTINQLRKDISAEYIKFSKKYGIVSLSETHRNLLMWAHYGSAHKGVCVGYKTDLFTVQKPSPSLENTHNLSPQRIKYDSERFDVEYFYDENKVIDILLQAIRTKSNEWIYEKEHRCIVPFNYGDKIIIKKSPNIELEIIIKTYEKLNYLANADNNQDGDYETYIINKELNDNRFEAIASTIAHHDDVMMLKNISLESIDSIYLGSQYPNTEADKIIKLFREEKETYSHIKLYKYRINKNNFALDLIPIENCKIKADLDKIITERDLDIRLYS